LPSGGKTVWSPHRERGGGLPAPSMSGNPGGNLWEKEETVSRPGLEKRGGIVLLKRKEKVNIIPVAKPTGKGGKRKRGKELRRGGGGGSKHYGK